MPPRPQPLTVDQAQTAELDALAAAIGRPAAELLHDAIGAYLHTANVPGPADDVPPRVPPRLKSPPKVREFFWCDLPKDSQLPELWKRRPVIIISPTAKLYGAVTVVPCSTKAQPDLRRTLPLRTTIDGRAAWAICDKPLTVAVSRLVPHYRTVPRMPLDEFHELMAAVLALLPHPPPAA